MSPSGGLEGGVDGLGHGGCSYLQVGGVLEMTTLFSLTLEFPARAICPTRSQPQTPWPKRV